MASQVYTEEQLNYFRICCIATDILPQGLRSIFKQEWDSRHKTTLGEWKDTPKNGQDFKNGESPANQRRNARLLATMINGNRAEWDCTMLFYAILHSDSIHGLSPVTQASIDDLRQFRNEDFAHIPHGQLSDVDFGVAVRKVETAFQALGLSTEQIQNISKQKSFPTDELQVLEEQLQREVQSFCVLPPRPSHQIAGRDYEVAKIEQELENLRKANENSLSYCYISGNPGSGKSQLAGLVAKRFYDEAIGSPRVPSFVMTLNAENSEALLESYVSLARKVSCPEYTVTNTHTSKDMEIEEKINNLKDLIATKIHFYTSWLIVVDNVTSVSRTHGFLPEPGNEYWGKGKLLITTQDSSCIPDSSFISHISICKGMELSDATRFLSEVSGIKDQEMEENIAKELDCQPLALASAATYVKQVRKLYPSFGWKDYLEKLAQGKRVITENALTNTNPSYPNSMTVATRIAVERVMNSDKVMKHAFTFLALCAPQPLRLDILTNYILNVDKDQDKEEIGIQIQGSSLLITERDEDGVHIRLHQVVHDTAKLIVKDCMALGDHVRIVDAAVKSFSHFIEETMPEPWNELDSVIESRHVVPHLNTLAVEIGIIFNTENKCQFFNNSISDVSGYSPHLQRLGQICKHHSEIFSAKEYFSAAMKLIEGSEVCDDAALADGFYFLGDVNLDLGNLQEAKEYFQRALSIQLKKFGSGDTEVAHTNVGLGTVHSRLGNYQEAKENYERALSIYLKKLGPESFNVAQAYQNLGIVHWHLKNYQQAKEYYERALSIKVKQLRPENAELAGLYNNLGLVQNDLGNLQQAKEYYERALSICLKTIGPEHVVTAQIYCNIGKVQMELGDKQQAKGYLERALSIRKKKLGPDHVSVARTLEQLRLCCNLSVKDRRDVVGRSRRKRCAIM